jgi:hypothetical protein
MQNTRYYFGILMKLEFSRQIFEKSSDIKFHQNPSSGRRVVPCEQIDRRTDMKLIVAIRSFANAPKEARVICTANGKLYLCLNIAQ